MKSMRALSGLCLSACILAAVASAEAQTPKAASPKPDLADGWHELGRVHVRDSAEKDLAFKMARTPSKYAYAPSVTLSDCAMPSCG